ncbi:hypothetical protein ACPXCG_17330 [Gordonia sp. DT218]|uniref:hypothetical protein n=1 Tax=Gordonia sp. DT218 TaxID=3416659 RepID=UPI003CF4CFD0
MDAGARPLSVLTELENPEMHDVTAVLVVSPRPDLLNRAREIFTEWDNSGVLARTIVVICYQVPTLNHQALTDMLIEVVAGRVAEVVGLDYEPILGDGTALDKAAQQRFSQNTWAAISQLAVLTTTSTVSR